MSQEHAGHRQRMRERFRTGGLDGFADHEVLELMLFYAIPQRNVNPLAHELLEHFGSLHAVLDAPAEELCRISGVGENAAIGIAEGAKGGEYTSIENFQARTGANSAVIKALSDLGCLDGLPQTDQLSLF